MSAPSSWSGIPAEVHRLLLRGSTGRDHLAGVATQAVALSLAAGADRDRARALAGLAQEILLAAWAENPLDGSLCQMLLSRAAPLWPALPASVADLLKAQANFWSSPPQDDPWWRATNTHARRESLLVRMAAEPRNLFWKLCAWDLAWPWADWELAQAALDEGGWPRTLAPLRYRFGAQLELARGDAHAALASMNALPQALGDDASLRASCLLAMGRDDEALALLLGVAKRSPWRTGDWLRAHDLHAGRHAAVTEPPGDTAILIYTFNKAVELEATLASLAESTLGGARIWALDNGSCDHTPSVLEDWRGHFGHRLSVVTLPVNIGAPAARNWLLSLAEVRRHPYLVFLDDDVSLPADWLGRLGAAVAAYPDASVWGCRVVDEANPLVAQNIDQNPVWPSPGDMPLVLSQHHARHPDLGRGTYLRPCVSVTGCCHLLRESDIDSTGGFDIRFSPSQFDDLERDLRLCLGGGHAAYQGHLRVLHKRRSGSAVDRNPADTGNATANTHKLLTKHGPETLLRVPQCADELLEADLRHKIEALSGV